MSCQEKRLHNIMTKEVVPDDVRDQLLNVEKKLGMTHTRSYRVRDS